MGTVQPSIKKDLVNSSQKDTRTYLEKKYGKEPQISTEELKKSRWNWH